MCRHQSLRCGEHLQMSSEESRVWQEAANQYAILLTLSQNLGCKMHIFAPQPQLFFFLSLVMLPWKWPMNQTSQSCCQWKEINLHEPCLAVSSPLQHPPGYRDSNMDTWHLIHWKLHRNQTDCRITFLAMLQHSITFVTTSSTESDTERGWLTGHVTTVLMSWWFLIPSSATSLSFLPFRLNPVQSHNLHLHNTSKS